jgi:hypothetical protein
LRLLRQADEWTNAYRFWSCADIDIKPRKEYRETCSGHGKYLATKCKCDKNYYGPRCQYWDECTVDQDCGLQGKCIDIGGSALPRKQCYCKLGWFGPGCNKSLYLFFSSFYSHSLQQTEALLLMYKFFIFKQNHQSSRQILIILCTLQRHSRPSIKYIGEY